MRNDIFTTTYFFSIASTLQKIKVKQTMTGIFYYFSKNEIHPPEYTKLETIAQKISHRGTYKKFIYSDKNSLGIFFLNKGQASSDMVIRPQGFSILDGI